MVNATRELFQYRRLPLQYTKIKSSNVLVYIEPIKIPQIMFSYFA